MVAGSSWRTAAAMPPRRRAAGAGDAGLVRPRLLATTTAAADADIVVFMD
jgi:hypothetical protein